MILSECIVKYERYGLGARLTNKSWLLPPQPYSVRYKCSSQPYSTSIPKLQASNFTFSSHSYFEENFTMASNSPQHVKLDSLYELWQKLGPASSDELFDEFGAFFDESCVAWLKSMREWDSPSIGRNNVIAKAKEIAKIQQLKERRVLSRCSSETGLRVVCEMKNALNVLGKPLDPFYESVMITFNEEGLITDFNNYSCRSPIVAIVQAVTGNGPYSEHDAKEEFE